MARAPARSVAGRAEAALVELPVGGEVYRCGGGGGEGTLPDRRGQGGRRAQLAPWRSGKPQAVARGVQLRSAFQVDGEAAAGCLGGGPKMVARLTGRSCRRSAGARPDLESFCRRGVSVSSVVIFALPPPRSRTAGRYAHGYTPCHSSGMSIFLGGNLGGEPTRPADIQPQGASPTTLWQGDRGEAQVAADLGAKRAGGHPWRQQSVAREASWLPEGQAGDRRWRQLVGGQLWRIFELARCGSASVGGSSTAGKPPAGLVPVVVGCRVAQVAALRRWRVS